MFSDSAQWITDKAPDANFLTVALFERYDNGSFANSSQAIIDDFRSTPKSLFTDLNSLQYFVGYNRLKGGLYPEDTNSVWLGRGSSPQCFKLVPDVKDERPYFRTCIVNPEGCEYGLSASIWVNFLDTQLNDQQTLISTCKFVLLFCYFRIIWPNIIGIKIKYANRLLVKSNK